MLLWSGEIGRDGATRRVNIGNRHSVSIRTSATCFHSLSHMLSLPWYTMLSPASRVRARLPNACRPWLGGDSRDPPSGSHSGSFRTPHALHRYTFGQQVVQNFMAAGAGVVSSRGFDCWHCRCVSIVGAPAFHCNLSVSTEWETDLRTNYTSCHPINPLTSEPGETAASLL